MKRSLTIFLIGLFYSVGAQQIPALSWFSENPYFYNPAAAGSMKGLRMNVGYRTQWTQFDGAPKTFFVSVDAPIYGSSTVGKTNQRLKGQVQNKKMFRTRKESEMSMKQGVGASFSSDNYGALRRTNTSASYSYHLPLNKIHLSFGLSLGYLNMSFNPNAVQLLDPNDQTYHTYRANAFSSSSLNIGGGLYLYHANGYLGYAVNQIMANNLNFGSGENLETRSHHIVTAGYRFTISEQLSLQPNGLLLIMNGLPLSTQLNTLVSFRKMIHAGVGVRGSDAILFLLGFQHQNLLRINYSYEVGYSNLRSYHGNTHEVILSFMLSGLLKK